MKINLSPNPHGSKFSNEFKGKGIYSSAFISVSICHPAVTPKSAWDPLLESLLLKL